LKQQKYFKNDLLTKSTTMIKFLMMSSKPEPALTWGSEALKSLGFIAVKSYVISIILDWLFVQHFTQEERNKQKWREYSTKITTIKSISKFFHRKFTFTSKIFHKNFTINSTSKHTR